MLALLGLLTGFFCYNCLFLPFFRIVFQTLLPWWTFYTALFVYGKYYLIKNRNMALIQGGHCPWSKIQGGQPTTLTPPCRAPGPTAISVSSERHWQSGVNGIANVPKRLYHYSNQDPSVASPALDLTTTLFQFSILTVLHL